MPFELIEGLKPLSLVKEAGVYRQAEEVTDEETAAADAVYLGGRRYVLTPEQETDLVNAGYGEWITEVDEGGAL